MLVTAVPLVLPIFSLEELYYLINYGKWSYEHLRTRPFTNFHQISISLEGIYGTTSSTLVPCTITITLFQFKSKPNKPLSQLLGIGDITYIDSFSPNWIYLKYSSVIKFMILKFILFKLKWYLHLSILDFFTLQMNQITSPHSELLGFCWHNWYLSNIFPWSSIGGTSNFFQTDNFWDFYFEPFL